MHMEMSTEKNYVWQFWLITITGSNFQLIEIVLYCSKQDWKLVNLNDLKSNQLEPSMNPEFWILS